MFGPKLFPFGAQYAALLLIGNEEGKHTGAFCFFSYRAEDELEQQSRLADVLSIMKLRP